MTRQNRLKQAKEGNETAIATLLDIALEHKQIHVSSNLKNGFLQIKLISETIPDWKSAIILIDRELQRINSFPSICDIKIALPEVENIPQRLKGFCTMVSQYPS